MAEPDELDAVELAAAERLVRAAFGASFRAHDWLHAVDGVHVMVSDGDDLLAHASVVPRALANGTNTFDTGYVEGVAVRADQRGRGLGRLVMDHAEAIIRHRHHVGALNAVDTAADFYAARGWHPWTGRTAARGPAGLVDTYDSADRIFLFPAPPEGITCAAALVCDWRVGDLW